METGNDTNRTCGGDARAWIAHETDNVATMLTPGTNGDTVRLAGDAPEDLGRILLLESIPVDHKVAVRSIAPDELVIKFGARIGRASTAIPAGGYVHVQNVRSERVPGAGR